MERMRDNPYIASTIILAFMCLVLIFVWQGTSTTNKDLKEFNETFICENILGTPSWVNEDMELVLSGYNNFSNANPREVLDLLLIPKKIHYFYRDDCSWCQKQKEYFGKYFREYVDANLTHDCNKILKVGEQ